MYVDFVSLCESGILVSGTNLFKLIFNIGTLLLVRSCVGAHALQTMCINNNNNNTLLPFTSYIDYNIQRIGILFG